MKKCIAVGVFVFSLFFLINLPNAFAISDISTIAPQPSVSPVLIMEHKEIVYDFPYPGILPDNPFYFLKTFRDKIIGLFISDPLKKAEFDLLASDKRLMSGVALEKKRSKDDLITSVLSKGANYFEEAITKTKEARGQSEDTSSLISKLVTASQKHQEVLKNMEITASNNLKAFLVSDEKRMADLQVKASTLQGK